MRGKVSEKCFKNICKMDHRSDKYEKLIGVLKKSIPDAGFSAEYIGERVMKSISSGNRPKNEIIDYVFKWVNIGWLRRSLITASFLLIGIFILQQRIMMDQITDLSQQISRYERMGSYDPYKRLEFKKLVNSELQSGSITIPEKDLNSLLDSVRVLSRRYEDIMQIIGRNPELKKSVQKEIKNRSKMKL